MTKRQNGEGTITRRKDGRYAVGFTDPATGNRRWRYARTEADAKRILRDMTTRADTGEVVMDARSTLSAYVEAWLADRAGRRRSPATVGEYRWRLDKYVLPRLGSTRIGELTVVDVEDLLDDLAAADLTTATLKGVRNALAAVLTDAIRSRHLRAGNVARMAQLPDAPTTAKVVPPTTAQVRALLKATEGTDLGRVLVVLASTGARIGEVLAARWSDVDLTAGVWTVSRTVTRDDQRRTTVGDRTKTGSARTVRLGPAASKALREQRREVARRALSSLVWQDNDLIFPTDIGTAVDPRNLRKDLRPVAATVGWPGSFHSLRHFVASVALAETGNEVLTAKVLGHARKATTVDVYGHLLADDALGVSAAVERRLAGS